MPPSTPTRARPSSVSPGSPWLARAFPTALKLAFTAAVLVLLVGLVGWRELVNGLSTARWPWLVGMYCVALVNFAAMAGCLHRLLATAGVGVSFGRVLLANALANLYALVLPGDLMAGVSKWVVLSAATGERAKVLSAIVLNKVVLALPPLLFGTLALALESPFPALPVGRTAALLAALTIVGLVLVLHPRAGRLVDRSVGAVARPLPAGVRAAIDKGLDAVAAFRAFGARDHLAVLSIAVGVFWLGIGSFYCATRALALEVPVATLVWISLALFVSRLLPITFNNLGVREGLLILALAPSGVEAALALAVGLLMFSNTIWIGLVGAGCQLAVASGWASLQDEGRVAPERRSLELGDPP